MVNRLGRFFYEVAVQTGQSLAAGAVTTVTYTVGTHAVQAASNEFFLAAKSFDRSPQQQNTYHNDVLKNLNPSVR
ncbi:MAG: hypothetical protein H0U75_04730 [Legionella sp.]|nr:hypothetical protein [Legionella sp.]